MHMSDLLTLDMYSVYKSKKKLPPAFVARNFLLPGAEGELSLCAEGTNVYIVVVDQTLLVPDGMASGENWQRRN